MHDTATRRIVVGVSGGIAAYKSPDLVRRLREREHSVRVVMSAAAREFITPLTLQAVSGNPVHTDLLDSSAEAAMGHIELARWANLVLVAPATANFLAKLRLGLADDLLSTLCLATEAPIAVAPAMNRQMWRHPATQDNVAALGRRGVRFIGPAEGDQACGETGPGRMEEPEVIASRVSERSQERGDLEGLAVLVTAGPTREPLDPVRFISNHSSGRMGYALAEAAAGAGARVTLVSGPTAISTPPRVECVEVMTAAEMCEAVMNRVGDASILIAAAAVADHRPAVYRDRKIKKNGASEALALERTPDILAEVATLPRRPFTVGFAAETDDIEANARAKLEAKALDLIAANRVDGPGVGFASEDNALDVYWASGGVLHLGHKPKRVLAEELVALIAQRYRAAHPA